MNLNESLVAKDRSFYTYRCKNCGWENRKKLISGSGVPVTRIGSYGSTGTPTPETFADEMYEATTIAFVAAAGSDPAYLTDSLYLFGEKNFNPEMTLRVETTSGTNDGDYTVDTTSRGVILLDSSDSLTTESAATAGTVTLSKVIYKPAISSGCSFCGSLASV